MLTRLWTSLTGIHIGGFGRFTDRSRLVMKLANGFADQQAEQWIAPEHVLLGIMAEGSGVGVALLRTRRISIEKIRAGLQQKREAASGPVPGRLPLAARTEAMIRRAQEESAAVGDDYVGTQHLLLSLVRDGESAAGEALEKAGADLEGMREHLRVWRRLWSAWELVGKGKYVEAGSELLAGTAMTPPEPISANGAAWFLATCPEDGARNGAAAVRVAQELCSRTNWARAVFLDTLAAACAEAGDSANAQGYQEKAISLLTVADRKPAYQQHLEAYRQGRPWREAVGEVPEVPDLPKCWPEE